MSLTTAKKYRFKEAYAGPKPPLFELESIYLETSCVANKSHQSDNYKIFFVEAGSGSYQVDFQEFTIENSGIFFLSPGQVLTVESESLKSGFQISFDKDFYCVESQGKEIACNGVLFNNVHRATFLQLTETESLKFKLFIDQMIGELERPGKAHMEMLETYLRLFLIEALRILDQQASTEKVETDPGNRLVGDFIALVDKHFRKIHAVSEYAKMLYVSPKSLAKRLHAHGYKTPTEVIRDRIVLEAKRNLRYTQKSVKEIAFDLGFEDPAYFTRYFKKSEAESPQNYRLRFG